MTAPTLIAECVAALEAEYRKPDGEDEHIVEIVAPIIERHVLASMSVPPEPVYTAVERILDKKSAWVARPDGEVTMAIAIAATLAAMDAVERTTWLPIATAPTQCPVNRAFNISYPVFTTETRWVKDTAGRIFEACFVRDGAYWWDFDGETKCEPVEWMPHPLWTPEE